MRTPERYRRAATTGRIENVTAVFRASFPEVPAEVVAGHLGGERMLSLSRLARRILAIHAENYDRAVASMIAGDAVYSHGVRISDFDEDAVAASLERHHVTSLSALAFGRMISRIANGGSGV